MSKKNRENRTNNVSHSTIIVIDKDKVNKDIKDNEDSNENDEYKEFCNQYMNVDFFQYKVEELKKIYEMGNGLLNQYFITGSIICDSDTIFQIQYIVSAIMYQINMKQAYDINEKNKALNKSLSKNVDEAKKLKRDSQKMALEMKHVKNDVKSIITTIISIILTISIIPTAITAIDKIDANYVLPFLSSIILFGMITIIFVYSIYQNKIKLLTWCILLITLMLTIVFWIISFNKDITCLTNEFENNTIENVIKNI